MRMRSFACECPSESIHDSVMRFFQTRFYFAKNSALTEVGHYWRDVVERVEMHFMPLMEPVTYFSNNIIPLIPLDHKKNGAGKT